MANFCSHCGAASRPGANFCEQCGTRLAPEAAKPRLGADGEGAGSTDFTINAGSAYDPFPERGLKQQLFTTRGRLNRWRYFKRCWAVWGLALLLFIVSFVLFGTHHAVLGGLTLLGIVVGAEAATICLVIRRFHDMEPADSLGGNFLVMRLGAYVGCIIASGFWDWAGVLSALMNLYLMFNPGIPGANRHGADPLAN